MTIIKSHIAVILLFIITVPASATIITAGTYVSVVTDMHAGSGIANGGGTRLEAATTADSGLITYNNGSFNANGRAFASIARTPVLKAISSSTAPNAASFFASSSGTRTNSSWRDVLLPGAAGAPSSINFNFSVHARLSVSQTTRGLLDSNNSSARVRVTARNSILGFATNPLLTAGIRNFNGGLTQTILNNGVLGWDTAVFTEINPNEYDFNGSFSFNSPLLSFTDPAAPFGAYFLGVGLSSETGNVGGSSTANAFNTLTLDSITLASGEALPNNMAFNFESGTSISSVPLPPSFFLLLSAVIATTTIFRRRAIL